MSLLFVDSTSEISHDLAHKLGIEKIDLPLCKSGEIVTINEDFDIDKFYSKYKKGIEISNVSLKAEDYEKYFEECFERGDDVTYVHAGSEFVNIDELNRAKENLETKYPDRRLELIDSKNISIGQGLVSYACAMLYRDGYGASEIMEQSFAIRDEYAFYFACDNLNTLIDNNLVETKVSFGTALNIVPILTINLDGKIELFDKISGKKKAILKLLEIIRQKGENVADFPVSITYTSDENSARELEQKIKETFGEDTNIMLERMSPNSALYLGNVGLGISFHVHKKQH